jgi:hypothetical protein
MRLRPPWNVAVAAGLLLAIPAHAQWVEFDDETLTMLSITSVPEDDGEEKDVAVADFDLDGWNDLIVVRKEPFSNRGRGSTFIIEWASSRSSA